MGVGISAPSGPPTYVWGGSGTFKKAVLIIRLAA